MVGVLEDMFVCNKLEDFWKIFWSKIRKFEPIFGCPGCDLSKVSSKLATPGHPKEGGRPSSDKYLKLVACHNINITAQIGPNFREQPIMNDIGFFLIFLIGFFLKVSFGCTDDDEHLGGFISIYWKPKLRRFRNFLAAQVHQHQHWYVHLFEPS